MMKNSQKIRLAFAGFRHPHILELYKAALKHPAVEIVAASEDDAPAHKDVEKGGLVRLTHDDHRRMLADVPCDAVAVGDYYGRRGRILIDALEAGRCVIADKPICTRTDELEQIVRLSATRELSVGCMLDMRDGGYARTLRRLIREGAIGEVHTVSFAGQHPLMYGTRAGWYFEQDKQGGTINDIAIHAVDAIPWMTGRKIVEVIAARVWNARLKKCPDFQDGAQMLLRLDNGGGVIGDVSYLAPDKCGYAMPQYWRMVVRGSDGVLEGSFTAGSVFLVGSADTASRQIPCDPDTPGGYLESFIREVTGAEKPDDDLSTRDVLEAARITLAIQAAADKNLCNVGL